MKIVLYSDIHLERQQFTPGPRAKEADLVVLAGDIGQGIEGLRWAREAFEDKPIVAVLGNHEFFGGHDFDKFLDDARSSARALDIDLLECEEVSVSGVRFLGATLWTDFELFSPDADDLKRLKDDAQISIRDYSSGEITVSTQAIRHNTPSGPLTPEATVRRHKDTKAWLENALKCNATGQTVVVTHHCPSLSSIPPQFRTGANSRFSPAYASDLSYLGGRCALWLHGHVHEPADYDMNGTRVVCNPMGYCSKELGPQNSRFTDLLIDCSHLATHRSK